MGELGEDFHGVTMRALTHSEVAYVLAEKRAREPEKKYSKAFLAAEAHTSRVAQFKEKATVVQVRLDLEKTPFSEFEQAQLADLCPEDVREAKTLVQSLVHVKDRDPDDAQLVRALGSLHQNRTET